MRTSIPLWGNVGKRNLEGTNLNSENSFSALDNEEIISKSDLMGVHISDVNYSDIDLIKDLEVARHSLEEKKKESYTHSCDEEIKIEEIDEERSDLEEVLVITPKRNPKPIKRLSLSGQRRKKTRARKILL